MSNIRLRSIENYADVSSINNFNSYHLKESIEKRLKRIHLSSRDSSRTPMQWTADKYAGFSTHEPWFYVNRNHAYVNVDEEEHNESSLLNFYRKCLQIRKNSRTLIYGKYKEYFPKDPYIYMYERSLEGMHYLIICSFAKHTLKVRIPKNLAEVKLKLVISNYAGLRHSTYFAPYEARVYRFRK